VAVLPMTPSSHESGTMQKVQGICPMGCGETLFLGDGGYVTCSWMECPDPAAPSEMLTKRYPTEIERLVNVLVNKAMNE
jgi:hypothetical protein